MFFVVKSIKSSVASPKVRITFFTQLHIVIMRDVENAKNIIKRRKHLFY